jgi:hypothetical protein
MSRKCSICNHDRRQEVEHALLRGESNRAVAQRFPNGAHDDVVDATTQALNYLRVKPELWAIVLGPSSVDRELDKEALWEKAMLGYPMTEAEIARM